MHVRARVYFCIDQAQRFSLMQAETTTPDRVASDGSVNSERRMRKKIKMMMMKVVVVVMMKSGRARNDHCCRRED